MKTFETKSIKNEALVATYNADPFAVEDDDLLAEVMQSLGDTAMRYDKEDEEFADLAAKLDGNEDTYQYILTNEKVIVGIL